jgi:hypothetical protein
MTKNSGFYRFAVCASLTLGLVFALLPSGFFGGIKVFAQNYTQSSLSYNWIDVSTGTDSGLSGDDNSTNITLPFSFNYFGNSYTSLDASTNGMVGFSSSSYTYGAVIPSSSSPNDYIAVFNADMNILTGHVYYDTIGTAPNRQFVIQWQDVNFYSGGIGLNTFEVILNETTNNIDIQFNTVDSNHDHSVGIEDSTGINGYQYSYNQNNVLNSSAIRYSPQPDSLITSASCVPSTVYLGSSTICTANFPSGNTGTVTFSTTLNSGSCTTPTITTVDTTASCSLTTTAPANLIPVTSTATFDPLGAASFNSGSITVQPILSIVNYAQCVPSTTVTGNQVTCTANFPSGNTGTATFYTSPNAGGCTTTVFSVNSTQASCSFITSISGSNIVATVTTTADPLGAPAFGAGSLNLTSPVTITTLDKKFIVGGLEKDNLTGLDSVVPGSTITERIYYNNTGNQAGQDAQIQSQFPAGFTVTSLKNCLKPSVTETACSTNLPTTLVNGSNQLNVSPVAGLYGATQPYTPGIPSGTTTGSSKGILETGKKRYLNIDSCTYYKSATDTFFQSWIDRNNSLLLTDYDAGTNASNTQSTTSTCGPGNASYVGSNPWSTVNSYDTLSNRYLNLHHCTYYNSPSDAWFFSYGDMVYSGLPTQMDSGTNVSNTIDSTVSCGVGSGAYPQNPTWSDVNGFDLLGKRYLNIHQCTYYKSATDTWFSSINNHSFDNNYDSATNTSNVADTTPNCGPGSGASQYIYNTTWNDVQSLDLLDTGRGKGYIEVVMVAPSSIVGTSQLFSQTANLNGSNFTTVNDGAQIELQNTDKPIISTDKKFIDSQGNEQDNLLGSEGLALGSTFTERIYYNNTGNIPGQGANISFDTIGSVQSIKNCLLPSSTETICSSPLPVSNETNTGVTGSFKLSPSAGLYDTTSYGGYFGGNGTAPNSNFGILETGKKRYLQTSSTQFCDTVYLDSYRFDTTESASNTYLSQAFVAAPGYYGCNEDVGGTAGTVDGKYLNPSIDLLGNRYLQTSSTQFCDSTFADWYRFDTTESANNTPVTPGFVVAPGYYGCNEDVGGTAGTVDGKYLNPSIDLLGNRYLQTSSTQFCDVTPGANNYRFDTTDTANNTPATTGFVSAPGYYGCNEDVGGTAGTVDGKYINQSIDLLDTSRGKGYFEIVITLPTTLPSTYPPTLINQNGTLITKYTYNQEVTIDGINFIPNMDIGRIELSNTLQHADLMLVKTSTGGSYSRSSGINIIQNNTGEDDQLSNGAIRPGVMYQGLNYTYTLTLTNNGPDIAVAPLQVIDRLDPDTEYISHSGTGWTCATSTIPGPATQLTCTNPTSLISGSTSQIFVNTKVI